MYLLRRYKIFILLNHLVKVKSSQLYPSIPPPPPLTDTIVHKVEIQLVIIEQLTPSQNSD